MCRNQFSNGTAVTFLAFKGAQNYLGITDDP